MNHEQRTILGFLLGCAAVTAVTLVALLCWLALPVGVVLAVAAVWGWL